MAVFSLDSSEKMLAHSLAPPAAAMKRAPSLHGSNAMPHTSAGGASSTARVSFVVRSHTRITCLETIMTKSSIFDKYLYHIKRILSSPEPEPRGHIHSIALHGHV